MPEGKLLKFDSFKHFWPNLKTYFFSLRNGADVNGTLSEESDLFQVLNKQLE
jgi:hypothetical protein